MTRGIRFINNTVEENMMDLENLSRWTIGFISSCSVLFNKCDTEEEEEDWNAIYLWRGVYRRMEWSELKPIVNVLVTDYLNSNNRWGTDNHPVPRIVIDVMRDEIVTAMDKLFSVISFTRTFQLV